MALNLANLLADYNGAALSVAGYTEYGYVSDEWKIAIPAGCHLPNAYTIGRSEFAGGGAHVHAQAPSAEQFLKANYHQCRGVAGTNENALFVALLRLHIASQGTLTASLANRAVLEDEYILRNNGGADWTAPENDIPAIPTAPAIAKFVKKFGNAIMHSMVLLFRSRGHHYKPDYDALYNRLFEAQFIPRDPGFPLPSNDIMYRAALHGFGVRPLDALCLHHKANSLMSAAMALRWTPDTAIAGIAHITTGVAVLNEMSKESWYAAFEAKFNPEITAMRDNVTAVMAAATTYHVAARIFGHAARTMPHPNAERAFIKLSQFLVGYINYLGRRHPMYGQVAVTKKSGGARGTAESFERACDKFSKPSTDVANMATFLGAF